MTGTSGSSTSVRPTSATTSAYVVPADLRRTPATTQIADPVTADLCAVIDLDSLPSLGAGLTPSFDARQFPPGCSITVRDGATSVLALSVFARHHPKHAPASSTTRVESGQTVLVYPFDPKTGACRRDIVADGVRLVVDAFASGADVPSKSVACTGTDAVTSQVAAAVAGSSVPRLQLADPSVSELNACAVVERAGVAGLAAFAGSRLIPRGFRANCELARGTKRFLFVNFELATTRRPPGATATSVGGHRIFEIASRPGYCAYTAAEAATGDGRYERVAVSATDVGSGPPPAQMCSQTAQALADYLTAAGLD